MIKFTDNYQPAIYKPDNIVGYVRKYYYISDYLDKECLRFRYYDFKKEEYISIFPDEKDIVLC